MAYPECTYICSDHHEHGSGQSNAVHTNTWWQIQTSTDKYMVTHSGGNKQSSMRMRAGPGKSWPRRAAPRSGCSLVPAQIRLLDCCSHMSFHLWPLRSSARCHDNGPYRFSKARCHSNGPDCTILHAILRSKCIRDVTEHVGTLLTSYKLFLAKRSPSLKIALRETICKKLKRVPPLCVTSSECRALFRMENLALSKTLLWQIHGVESNDKRWHNKKNSRGVRNVLTK